MDLSNITINAQSSIKINGSSILYFDPISISTSVCGADFKKIVEDNNSDIQVELRL